MTGAAGLVTAAYRVRLAGALARQGATLARLWGMWNPELAVDTLTAIGAAAGPVVAVGQAMFAAEALAYLRALTANAAGETIAATAPYVLPPAVVGMAASGAPVGALTGFAPRVFEQRRAQGWEIPDAYASARAHVEAVAVSEPYRAANATVTHNADLDDRLTGRVNRMPEPDACEWCVLISDRGYLPATAGFAAHAYCRCTASPEISRHVTSRRQQSYAARRLAAARVPAQRAGVG